MTAKHITQSSYMRTAEAAKYLNLANGTLPSWRSRRFGPPFSKIGKTVLYRREDLDEFVRSMTVVPETGRSSR